MRFLRDYFRRDYAVLRRLVRDGWLDDAYYARVTTSATAYPYFPLLGVVRGRGARRADGRGRGARRRG